MLALSFLTLFESSCCILAYNLNFLFSGIGDWLHADNHLHAYVTLLVFAVIKPFFTVWSFIFAMQYDMSSRVLPLMMKDISENILDSE